MSSACPTSCLRSSFWSVHAPHDFCGHQRPLMCPEHFQHCVHHGLKLALQVGIRVCQRRHQGLQGAAGRQVGGSPSKLAWHMHSPLLQPDHHHPVHASDSALLHIIGWQLPVPWNPRLHRALCDLQAAAPIARKTSRTLQRPIQVLVTYTITADRR